MQGHKVPQENSSCLAIGNGIKNLASKPLLKPGGCIYKPSTATRLFDHDEKEKTKKKIRSSIHGRCCENSAVVSHHGPVPSSALLVKFSSTPPSALPFFISVDQVVKSESPGVDDRMGTRNGYDGDSVRLNHKRVHSEDGKWN
ncbi:uncharacterized protein LOC115685299 [Syzygium oleosum]|uniref:uncharacterized protein LOC115685299 n=1 Tax=Syzygium oleosum TaxID=219896 RepID=UPI0024B940E2|nr:uncharacterized protein LOC115685299 [Syzygium oleosum]